MQYSTLEEPVAAKPAQAQTPSPVIESNLVGTVVNPDEYDKSRQPKALGGMRCLSQLFRSYVQ